MLDVRFKKSVEGTPTPKYSRDGDAGIDLVAMEKTVVLNKQDEIDYIEYDTYISVEIPRGYLGLLFPRSSNSKYDLLLSNSVGVVDSNYRGTIRARFKPTHPHHRNYEVGDRCIQLVIIPYPTINLIESEELSDTERGTDGFGSSGK